MIKEAVTQYPVHELIRKRWSARAFSSKSIEENTLFTLFEAATWAASANNEQPWRYIYARREDGKAFEKMANCLLPGNHIWARNAAVLIISLAKTTWGPENKTNIAAHHDVGLANATLLLQAVSQNIYGHMMGGFDRIKTRHEYNIPEGYDIMIMMALGYLDNPETLEEPFRTREMTPRTRRALGEVVFHNEMIP